MLGEADVCVAIHVTYLFAGKGRNSLIRVQGDIDLL